MVWVLSVAVPTAAIAPFGFDIEPALKKVSERLVLAKSPVPQVRTVAKGSLWPLFALLISELPNPLTPTYPL